MNWDQQDRFINSLEHFKDYPKNILDPVINISRYAKKLDGQATHLFSVQVAPIEFIEMLPGDMRKMVFTLGITYPALTFLKTSKE